MAENLADFRRSRAASSMKRPEMSTPEFHEGDGPGAATHACPPARRTVRRTGILQRLRGSVRPDHGWGVDDADRRSLVEFEAGLRHCPGGFVPLDGEWRSGPGVRSGSGVWESGLAGDPARHASIRSLDERWSLAACWSPTSGGAAIFAANLRAPGPRSLDAAQSPGLDSRGRRGAPGATPGRTGHHAAGWDRCST